jgi:hypothetical protein
MSANNVKVTVLSRTPFTDRTNPNSPQEMMDIVYQLTDGRIGTATIKAVDAEKPAENTAIADSIKKLAASVTSVKEIKL